MLLTLALEGSLLHATEGAEGDEGLTINVEGLRINEFALSISSALNVPKVSFKVC